MMPYYSFPFSYFDRNSTMMPQAPAMVSPTVQQTLPVPQQPAMVPMVPTAPTQPLNPMMPMMHTCPCPYMMMNMPMMQPMAEEEMDEVMDADLGVAAGEPDPNSRPPVLSNNPAVPSITLFKELTGYPNYGNPSGNADILYTGDRGTWTFEIPPFFPGLGNLRAQILIRAVLDDHYNVPVSRYSATISINNTNVHTGRLPLEHGSPAGARFTNWGLLTFNIPNVRRNNRVVIVNTSNTGPSDWIALDWMELRITTRR